jgi:hypothetical protein
MSAFFVPKLLAAPYFCQYVAMRISNLEQYQGQFNRLLNQPVNGLCQDQKQALLLPLLTYLDHLHLAKCKEFNNISLNSGELGSVTSLSDLGYLAVRLFKHLELKSIPDEQVFKVLRSSGTTSQTPASIYLDKETSSRQSKTLVKILQQTIGKQRLPMLIIDSPRVVQDPKFSARAAGIQGLMFFGRDHTYALDEHMQPNWPVIQAFSEKYQGQAVLVFGFTFMIWLHFIQELIQQGKAIDLTKGVLLHSGGWKKLESEKVNNLRFKQILQQHTGIKQVHNFYGMAEQVGSIFVECTEGHLHAPVMADVIVRDPVTLLPSPINKTGLIQVLSALPTSYPGHSLLTEDMGTLLGIDDCPCGQKGKYFCVQGRLPKTEVRGCSDTQTYEPHV